MVQDATIMRRKKHIRYTHEQFSIYKHITSRRQEDTNKIQTKVNIMEQASLGIQTSNIGDNNKHHTLFKQVL